MRYLYMPLPLLLPFLRKFSFLFLVGTLICNSNYILAQKSNPKLKVGLVTDIQYCDCEAKGKRHYRGSLDRLDSCILHFNKEKVDFSFHLGDIIDRDVDENLQLILDRFNKMDNQICHLLGNHDVSAVYQEGYRGRKGDVAFYKLLNDLSMTKDYYYIKKDNIYFMVLNTNDIAGYALDLTTNLGKQKYEEFESMKDLLRRDSRNNGGESLAWNGGIGKEQINWIEKTLDEAERNKQIVIIMAHQAPYPENGLQILNNRELLNLIIKYKSVKAIFAGHHHSGAFVYYKGIPVVTLEGLLEGYNFAILNFYNDRIELKGIGKTQDRIFYF